MTNKTGVVKIGDNWPGIYITGQDALIRIWCDVDGALRFLDGPFASDLNHPLRKMYAKNLREFLKLLDSCEQGRIDRSGVDPLQLEVKTP